MLFKSRKDKRPDEAVAAKQAVAMPLPINGAATPAGTKPGRQPAEEAKRRADYSHRVMQAFGAIVAVYMRSKPYREMRLGEIESLVAPAVTTGQFSLAEATHKQNGLVTPVAVVLWARVSDAIDARIKANPEPPLSLTPAEWTSGSNIWVVDAVGDQTMIGAVLKQLQDTTWKGRTAKMRTQAADGKIVTHVLTSNAGG